MSSVLIQLPGRDKETWDVAPRYREVADTLRERIVNGTYERGEAIPPQTKLAAEFSVSQPVVNRAIVLLRSEGLVRIERGSRTVVHEIMPILRNANRRYAKGARERDGNRGAFDTEVRRLGHTPRAEIVQTGPVTPPREVAELLGFEQDEVAAIRARHMYADDIPVQIATSYVPWSIAAGTAITQPDTGPGGLYSRLEELGHRITRFTERIRTRLPSSEESTVLRISEDQAVYAVEHLAFAGDRVVEVAIHVMPTSQWTLEYDWAADPE